MQSFNPHGPERFDEAVQFGAPNPGGNWAPTPQQIREWGAIVKSENDERDRLTDDGRDPD